KRNQSLERVLCPLRDHGFLSALYSRSISSGFLTTRFELANKAYDRQGRNVFATQTNPPPSLPIGACVCGTPARSLHEVARRRSKQKAAIGEERHGQLCDPRMRPW